MTLAEALGKTTVFGCMMQFHGNRELFYSLSDFNFSDDNPGKRAEINLECLADLDLPVRLAIPVLGTHPATDEAFIAESRDGRERTFWLWSGMDAENPAAKAFIAVAHGDIACLDEDAFLASDWPEREEVAKDFVASAFERAWVHGHKEFENCNPEDFREKCGSGFNRLCRNLERDGNGKLRVPSKYHDDWVVQVAVVAGLPGDGNEPESEPEKTADGPRP